MLKPILALLSVSFLVSCNYTGEDAAERRSKITSANPQSGDGSDNARIEEGRDELVFDPENPSAYPITGLVQWLNPADASVDAFGKVMSLPDRIDANRSFEQPTEDLRPEKTQELNTGLSVLEFDGTNDYLFLMSNTFLPLTESTAQNLMALASARYGVILQTVANSV